MKNIFTIAKWELTRLRLRFSGRSRLVILGIIFLALISSYLIYHQGLVISKGLYTIGVSFDGPSIADKRFNVIKLSQGTGHTMLREKSIDLYVDGNKVLSRDDERSQYAAGALQKYLERQELVRIANDYEINRAFPLRIEISYLETPEASLGKEAKPPLSEVSEPTKPIPAPPEISRPLRSPAPPVSSTLEPEPQREPTAPSPSAPNIISGERLSRLPQQPGASATDIAVRQQLNELESSSGLPKFKAEFISENDIIIPSLMNPPIPLAQVIIAFLYVVPLFFVSVFFTSSFAEERTSRKLIVLLSAPVSPFQIILGKMLPYLIYSVVVITGITLALQGSVLLSLAVFTPVMLFIFSIYLMVALMYRTFKDQTFFSVLALSATTLYLVVPAMFSGVSDLSYISPLTLAVEIYRGKSFGINEYFLATTPLYLFFLQAMFIGTRLFNEEYLTGFKPLHTKVAEAFYLAIDKRHRNISVLVLSLLMVPLVFMAQLTSIVFVSNLPKPLALWLLIAVSATIEEIAKSAGIIALLRNNIIRAPIDVIKLSFLSALGVLLGEKLLLFLALSVLSESVFTSAIFGSGLLVVPLVLHAVTTSVVCLITARFGTKYYPLAIMAGSVIHTLYNLYLIRALL